MASFGSRLAVPDFIYRFIVIMLPMNDGPMAGMAIRGSNARTVTAGFFPEPTGEDVFRRSVSGMNP